MIERLRRLRPWEQVNEEDLFFTQGLYLSIRGNCKLPEGVWATTNRAAARNWIMQPDTDPDERSWILETESGSLHDGVGQPLPPAQATNLEAAIQAVLDYFEGTPSKGTPVEFPVWFNVEDENSEYVSS